MIKIIFWVFVAMLWSPFEVIYICFTQKVSKIGLLLSKKLNNENS